MARYTGPKAKLSRREGTDLFLKSARRSNIELHEVDWEFAHEGLIVEV